MIQSLQSIIKRHRILVGEYEVSEEYLVSLEIAYDNETPVINGTLVFEDIFNINDGNLKDASVSIEYFDQNDDFFNKSFVILNVAEQENDKKEKVIFIELQDTFSYKFDKSFLSKSFSSTPKDALLTYIKLLGLDDIDIDASEMDTAYDFVIPSNQSNLKSFLSEFKKNGFLLYQTKKGISLKSTEDSLAKNLTLNDQDQRVFTDKGTNQYYENRIHNSTKQYLRRYLSPPKSCACAYDISTKTMKRYENNNIEEFSINNSKINLQEDSGTVNIYQQHTNFEEHRMSMMNMFSNQNETQITTCGRVKNDIMQVYDVSFIGLKTNVGDFTEGNTPVSGKYVSHRIVDKIIKKTFVQKIILKRVDMQKRIS